MSTDVQHLSIVHIALLDHALKLNELAFILQMGEDNLSIPLIDAENNQYLSNHSWWTKEKYAIFKDPDALIALGIDLEPYADAINSVYARVVDTEGLIDIALIPRQNFEAALAELDLTEVKEELTQEGE